MKNSTSKHKHNDLMFDLVAIIETFEHRVRTCDSVYLKQKSRAWPYQKWVQANIPNLLLVLGRIFLVCLFDTG